MSKIGTAIVAVLLVSAFCGAADARRHLGLGPLGGFTRLLAGGLFVRGRVHHRHARVHRIEHVAAPSQDAVAPTNERAGEEKLAVESLFTAPDSRRQIAADAALALWHRGQSATFGWWSHGHGGYGWVGPLFWPFAANDIYGYTIFADGTGFWDYGYPDVYAGIFAPYGYDELAAYMTPNSGTRTGRKIPPLQQFCGAAEHEIAALAVSRIQQAIQPGDEQRAVLDHLADASTSAARSIQASCPTQAASTAPARLALMQQRVAALLKAVTALEPPLQELYQLLNEDQKARLNALARNQPKLAAATAEIAAPAQGCDASASAALQWPAGEIESRLHPTEAQREPLDRLRRANADAVDLLSYECRPTDANTPSDRLAAVDRRLDALQQAINLVSLPLEDLYASLGDEQKAQFERIGQDRAR